MLFLSIQSTPRIPCSKIVCSSWVISASHTFTAAHGMPACLLSILKCFRVTNVIAKRCTRQSFILSDAILDGVLFRRIKQRGTQKMRVQQMNMANSSTQSIEVRSGGDGSASTSSSPPGPQSRHAHASVGGCYVYPHHHHCATYTYFPFFNTITTSPSPVRECWGGLHPRRLLPRHRNW